MVGIRSLLERGEMAGGTLRRRAGKFAADVALRTRNSRVRSGQRKHRCIVVKR